MGVCMFENLMITDNSKIAYNEILQWLKENNYVYLCEIRAISAKGNPPKEYIGFIDVVALKDGKRIAIEIDNKSPKKKSVYKLKHYKADERYILLRGGSKNYIEDGIQVISLKFKQGK
jgi:hypothetical protein